MIRIIALGKIKEKYLEDGINDYLTRVNKYHKVEIISLKDDPLISKEEKEILKYLNKDAYNILMDIEGELLTSPALASLINQKLMEYGNINIVIGSSNGVSDLIKKMVNKKISFGHITLPHGLFRLVLLEQLYRSFKINNNETYHK